MAQQHPDGGTWTLSRALGDALPGLEAVEVLKSRAGSDFGELGPEAAGGDVYWIDFLGEAALTDDEMRQVSRQAVEVEIRNMRASAGTKGGAFLNASGGAIRHNSQVVQRGLRTSAQQSSQPAQKSA